MLGFKLLMPLKYHLSEVEFEDKRADETKKMNSLFRCFVRNLSAEGYDELRARVTCAKLYERGDN